MLIEILGIRATLSSVDQLDLKELTEAGKGGIVDLAEMMKELEDSFLQAVIKFKKRRPKEALQ